MDMRTPPTDVRLLGPVELLFGGKGFNVGGPRAQAVLALLAVRAGEIITADWMVDQLWGEHPPRAARVALQSYISRLRKLSPPYTELMVPRHPRGYFLDTSAAGVDALRFVQLTEQGRNQAAGRRWREALDSLRSARALWRGVPFTGIDDVPALMTERERMEEISVETRFGELEAALEIVGPAEVVSSLRELVNGHPWDERGWRLLMLALYRAGRQTEALRAAARARRLLTEEQGLEPSHDLAELEHRILTHHPALNPTATPAVRLRGSSHPAPVPMVGREQELAELLSEWDTSGQRRQAGMVLVSGEPGVGKSHLAAALGSHVRASGGTVLVGRCLDEPRLPLQPWSELAAEVGAPESGDTPRGRPPVDASAAGAHRLFAVIPWGIREVLSAGPVLLVIEDVHWAGVAALRLLDHLLTTCTDLPLLVVATVRTTAADMPPATRGALSELSTRIQPHTIQLSGLAPHDLHALLTSRGIRLSIRETTAVWQRTDGIPLLAVEALRGGQRVLDVRLARASDSALTMADLVTMAGGSAPLGLLQLASGLDEDSVAAALEELIAVGVLRAAPGVTIAFEFRHSLYREVLEERLSELRQLLLSRRLITASDLAPHGVTPYMVARYALALTRTGVPADMVRALDACQRAGSCGEPADLPEVAGLPR